MMNKGLQEQLLRGHVDEEEKFLDQNANETIGDTSIQRE